MLAVDLLQRRIEKLDDALELARTELEQARSLSPLDDGLRSIYREVQGLSVDDPWAQAKRYMLTDIFEANLSLRARLAG